MSAILAGMDTVHESCIHVYWLVRQRAIRILHSKNWSFNNNSWSVIFNTSQECEEGQHPECYTNTSWGVAILTLRKCYRDLTIPEGCFDTVVSVALTLPEGCCDTLVTPSTGRSDTYTGCLDTFHGFFENWRWRVKHDRFFEHSVGSE